MIDDQPTVARQITGDDIISEILHNCDAGLFKIRRTVVLPCIYHTYLHPADYELIRPVISPLRVEAKAALTDKMERLSNAAKGSSVARRLGFAPSNPLEYKILDPDWTVEFHPDAESKLERGELEIHSELASIKRAEYGEGAVTRVVIPPNTKVDRAIIEKERTEPLPRPPSGTEYAVIRYSAENGPQTFEVTKDLIVVGRGGTSFWVDIKLNAPSDVSREHCRIRRDSNSGHFFIKDVSQFGTAVDGLTIPSSIEQSDGNPRDRNIEVPLPSRCIITLAGVVDLQFKVRDA